MPEAPDTIDDALDALVDPTTAEVLESTLTRDFSAREIAAAAVTRGGGGGTLQEVLTAGNDAGGLAMNNVGAIAASDVETTDDLEVGGTFSAANGSFSVDSGGSVSIETDDNAFYVDSGTGGIDLLADDVAIQADPTSNRLRVTTPALIVVGANAAPADGLIALPGYFALWFDATNGAAKLMVKAKTLDGTIVTGQISLT